VTGRHYKYAEMRQLSQRFASSLRLAGLQPGDTLIIVIPSTAEWPIVLLGAMEAGILVSTVNPSYTGGKYTDNALLTVADTSLYCDLLKQRLRKLEHFNFC
jgi:acyl-CoA synthetase (AMP-forming)/AMP-acid ligase II